MAVRCCSVLTCAASQLVDAPTVDSELISVLAGDYADEFDDARYFLVRWCTCTRQTSCSPRLLVCPCVLGCLRPLLTAPRCRVTWHSQLKALKRLLEAECGRLEKAANDSATLTAARERATRVSTNCLVFIREV